MKSVLIGHLVLDEIHTLDGSVYESLGGMAFPLYAFASVARAGDTVVPVFPLGHDAEGEFARAVDGFASVDPSHVFPVDAPNTRVRLYHESLSHYNTRLVAALESIPFERLSPALQDARLVYINMMTGDDITPDTIARIRETTEAVIYLDLHMISYAVEHDGLRHLNEVRNWRDWTRAIDILQCNELEHASFNPEGATERERVDLIFAESAVHLVLVTKGEAGTTIYDRSGQSIHIDAVPAAVVDPTGCGDVFGSVFAYIYSATRDAKRAGQFAAAAAAFVAGIPGSHGIHGLRTLLESIE